jgi:hypothetical protein
MKEKKEMFLERMRYSMNGDSLEYALIENRIKSKEFIHRNNRVTICIIKTVEDFYIVGTSFCMDPKQFTEELGEKFSYADTLSQFETVLAYHKKAHQYTLE